MLVHRSPGALKLAKFMNIVNCIFLDMRPYNGRQHTVLGDKMGFGQFLKRRPFRHKLNLIQGRVLEKLPKNTEVLGDKKCQAL
jgi:hypothetical protein